MQSNAAGCHIDVHTSCTDLFSQDDNKYESNMIQHCMTMTVHLDVIICWTVGLRGCLPLPFLRYCGSSLMNTDLDSLAVLHKMVLLIVADAAVINT